MDIFNKNYDFSKHYKGKWITVFPTDVNYAESDYEAAMDSIKELRLWSVSDWPPDDFTVAINREELQDHVDDNQDHCAYGFMIYDINKKKCYGSLYVNPIHQESFRNDKSDFNKFDARMDCWIRTNLEEQHKVEILKELKYWLDSEWKIKYGFTVRPTMPNYQKLMLKIGLERLLTMVYNDDSKVYLYG